MILDTTLLDDVVNGDHEFKLLLVGMIKTELITSVPEMISSLVEEDQEKLHALSHKLKTTLGYMANNEMKIWIEYIEQKSKSTIDDPLLPEYINKMNNLLPAYIQEIENLATSL